MLKSSSEDLAKLQVRMGSSDPAGRLKVQKINSDDGLKGLAENDIHS
jgi:hypothetical protein